MDEEYYQSWRNNNLDELRKEYCDLFNDNFQEYCKEQFLLYLQDIETK